MPKDSSLELVIFLVDKNPQKVLASNTGGMKSYSKLSKSHPVGFVGFVSQTFFPLLVSLRKFQLLFQIVALVGFVS